jgi:PEP-CTERM motif-containing protein
MIRKLTISLAVAILLLAAAPQARSDSITVAVNDIVMISPVIVNGVPDPTVAVVLSPSGFEFVGSNYDAQYPWELLQSISMAAFGDNDAHVLFWNNSMSLDDCTWFGSHCAGPILEIDDSGVIGTGTLFYSPHLNYMTIDSLTITAPEPGSIFLLGAGLLGLVGFFLVRILRFAVLRGT